MLTKAGSYLGPAAYTSQPDLQPSTCMELKVMNAL